jgi:parallel beta-helix repeat protein
VAGSDDFEDLMLGRIPAGSETELANYYHKLSSYTPLPPQAWAKSWLFAGGCYFAQRQDYVAFFDSLEAYMPDDVKVSRFYRYDFPATDAGDAQACHAILDSLDSGKLFLLYSGDGDKWDWGGRHERVFRSDLIDNLDNAGRLPIVISISCSNGWFDNATDPYKDGGFDCFAERLLTEPERGAIACLASSREAGGSASTVFAPEIIKSAYVNGSTFLGELILEAKIRHLANLGPVILVRQFNLFGDPCLNFDLNELPLASPDLLIRPYSIETSPDFPRPGRPIEISADIWNASGVSVQEFTVSLYSGHPDSGGAVIESQTCEDFWGWEKRRISFVVEDVDAGALSFSIVADAPDEIPELDESNNLVTVATYVYPFQSGYPIKVGGGVKGHVIADLDGDGGLDILVTSGGTYAAALDGKGSFIWVKDDMGLAQVFGGVEPSAFDLNGDGATEAILKTKSSLLVAEGATGNTIWQRYTEYPVVSPVVSDLDGDGSFEILMSTYDFTFSRVYAFDASGAYIWSHQIPTYHERITDMVVCDTELDGHKDVLVSSDHGDVLCLKCGAGAPTIGWDEHISDASISCMAAGDLNRDGLIDVVAAGSTTVYVLDAQNGSVEESIPVSATPGHMAIGDLDGDLNLEVVCTAPSGRIMTIDGSTVSLDITTQCTPVGSPVVADLDRDGVGEIIVTMEQGRVRIIRASGENFIAPVPMKGLCPSGPNTQDLDGDGNIEILAGSSDSLLFVLDMGIDGGRVDWLCEGGGPCRTGLYAQPVFGSITGDLALSGRVDVVGDLVVADSGNLVIERGSDIRFVCDDVSPSGSAAGKCEIHVEGSLISVGEPTALVNLGPWVCPNDRDDWMGIVLESGSSATITRSRIFGAVTGVECLSSDAYISECLITDCTVGLKVTEAAPRIDNNVVTLNNYGISTNEAPAIIVGNEVSENLYAGIVLSTSSDAVLKDNEIEHTTQGHGISCYSSEPSILGGNRIHHNSLCGIYLSNSSPTVDSCWIAFNGDCGIKAAYYSDPVISKTTIAANRIGVSVFVFADPVLGDSASMLGGQNDIWQNSQYALYNATANEIKAQMNWWGSDPPDPSAFVGGVDYSGWLSMPPAGVKDGPNDFDFAIAAFPNPFSHTAFLSMTAGEAQLPLDLAIYDVRGRLVRRLARITAPGEARVEWDGTDDFGNPAGPGIYYLAVRSRVGTRTSRLVLVR